MIFNEQKIICEVISPISEQDFAQNHKRKQETETESNKKMKNEEEQSNTSMVFKGLLLKTKKIAVFPEKCRVLFSKKKFLLLNYLFLKARKSSLEMQESVRSFFDEIKKDNNFHFSLSPVENNKLYNRIKAAFKMDEEDQSDLCFYSLEDVSVEILKKFLQSKENNNFKMLIGVLDLWEFKRNTFQETPFDTQTPTILVGKKKKENQQK